jgi:hypothetical protein
MGYGRQPGCSPAFLLGGRVCDGRPTTNYPVPDEFLLADATFSFANAFKEGKTPQEAYEAFDIFASAEA